MSSDYDPDTAKLLWINGPAGYGKTVLSASIIQHLLENPSPYGSKAASSSETLVTPTDSKLIKLPASTVAHYFFSSESGNKGNAFDIIRSWVTQVVANNEDAFEVAFLKYSAQPGPGKKTPYISAKISVVPF
jgi:hypothetical protein